MIGGVVVCSVISLVAIAAWFGTANWMLGVVHTETHTEDHWCALGVFLAVGALAFGFVLATHQEAKRVQAKLDACAELAPEENP